MSSAVPAASEAAPPHVVEDCLGIVQLLSDGTVRRSTDYSVFPLVGGVPPPDLPVEWKDVVYDGTRGLRLRMYRPTAAGTGGGGAEEEKKKLPVLVYFHGGGFCVASFELVNFHAGALRLAAELPAVVLSADYRLAPEHRLPAALDDAESVFSWLRNQATAAADDPWLAESADFGRVFVTGDSAGGNIAHHVAVAVGSGLLGISPARVAGYVLFWPFFAGVERTASEAEYPPGPFLTLPVSDLFLRLSLPSEGDTRDHPAVNPFGPDSPALDAVAFAPVLVVSGEHDLLRDRIADYVARLRAMGKPVELVEFQGQHHGFFVVEPWGDAGDELIRVVRRFVYGRTSCN
jgi:acetyl esterase/lipase